MSDSRRPSISIYDYPEHLNPFSDDITSVQPHHLYRDPKTKDSKHKFWTFGRSRKKRSNSFSIKSTWNGLFGKRKEDKSETQEKRSTITTVSSTYKREPYTKSVAPPSQTTDQQEFNEALGTLARRRKYTLDNSSSRYSSSLTVNGDPARLYDGSPQDTTTSIMGDLTPKPPARRFGQVSPKPTDKIPPLDYDGTSLMENEEVTLRKKAEESTPIPPLRRFGNRSSQRTNASVLDLEEEANRSGDVTLYDENENVPGQYVFKRCSQDPVRKSNLSINSCISVGSTMSSYGRKKRRAPQPPRRVENIETKENIPNVDNIELRIVEPIDIARVAENIDEMTKQSKEINENNRDGREAKGDRVVSTTDEALPLEKPTEENVFSDTIEHNTKTSCTDKTNTENESIENKEQEEVIRLITEEPEMKDEISEPDNKSEEGVQVEYRRASQENIEVIKDIDQVNILSELDDVCLRRKGSSGMLSRSDSFCVKDEIEKIEKQIKALETQNVSKDSPEEKHLNSLQENIKLSVHENRRHFFQNMVREETDKEPIKIEFKEFPREQKDIHVVRLNDSPVPTVVTREPVKVVELHISEPIRQKPEILEEVNPVPKPRRHSALTLNDSPCRMSPKRVRRSFESVRGKSF